MYDSRTRLAQQVVSDVRQYFGARVYSTVIPRSVRLSEAPSFGEPICRYAPGSAGGQAYAALGSEFLEGEPPVGRPAAAQGG